VGRCRSQIGAPLAGPLNGRVHVDCRSGREGDGVGQLVGVGRPHSDHAGEIDLLLCEIVLKRREPQLLRQRLNLAAVDVHLRHQPDLAACDGLLMQSVGGFDLRPRRSDARPCCGGLQIGAPYRKHDEVGCVLGGELRCAHDFGGRSIVPAGGDVDDGLRQPGAEIVEGERADNGREGRRRRAAADELKPHRRQIQLLPRRREIPGDRREQRASRHRLLAAGLIDEQTQVDRSKVVLEPALDRVAQRQSAGG
jgi:hypothetical protein